MGTMLPSSWVQRYPTAGYKKHWRGSQGRVDLISLMINKEIHQHGYKCLPHDCPLGHPLPGELGEASLLLFAAWCCRQYAVKGIGFNFRFLAPFTLFGVRGTITKKKFLLRLLSLFRFLQRRCKTDGYKAVGCDRSDSKFRIGILKYFLSKFLFDAFMRQLL